MNHIQKNFAQDLDWLADNSGCIFHSFLLSILYGTVDFDHWQAWLQPFLSLVATEGSLEEAL